MTRRMADEAFRLQEDVNRYAEHVKPINELVDSLRDQDARGWMPHVAPVHGGVDATALSILGDPGPKSLNGRGEPGSDMLTEGSSLLTQVMSDLRRSFPESWNS